MLGDWAETQRAFRGSLFKMFIWPSQFHTYPVLACLWNQPKIISHPTNYRNGTACSFFTVLWSWRCSSLTYVLWPLDEHQRRLLPNRSMPAVPPRARARPWGREVILSTSVGFHFSVASQIFLLKKMLSAVRKPFPGSRPMFGALSFAVFIEKRILCLMLLRRRDCMSIHFSSPFL